MHVVYYHTMWCTCRVLGFASARGRHDKQSTNFCLLPLAMSVLAAEVLCCLQSIFRALVLDINFAATSRVIHVMAPFIFLMPT